jgi:hypothetical protein
MFSKVRSFLFQKLIFSWISARRNIAGIALAKQLNKKQEFRRKSMTFVMAQGLPVSEDYP